MPTIITTRPWAIIVDGVPSSSGTVQVGQNTLSVSTSNGFGAENPFDTYNYIYEGGVVHPTTYAGKQYTFSGSSDFGSSASFGLGPDTWIDDASLWSRTNPSRPAVRLPVFWLELKDLPDMLRQAGRFLLAGKNWRKHIRRGNTYSRDVFTANLAFQFGWIPLISDLYKLADFQSQCAKRREEINRHKKKGGLRYKIGLGGEGGTIGVFAGYVNFGSLNFNPARNGKYGTTRWAVLKWRTTHSSGEIPTATEDLRPYLLGLTPGHILGNVWEALPWSWLIDYFTNIGDLLQAGNEEIAVPSAGSQMRKTTINIEHQSAIDWRWDGRNWTAFTLSKGNITATRKSRRPVRPAPTITASIPTLGTGQLSILASLAFLKVR